MRTWQEIENMFSELSETLKFHRLDYQWGAAGSYYSITGSAKNEYTRRFEIVARIAGLKLREQNLLPIEYEQTSISDAEYWYEALKLHSGSFIYGIIATQKNKNGEEEGCIYTGTINNFCIASTNFALRLSVIKVNKLENSDSYSSMVEHFFTTEIEKRGKIWAFIGFVITAVIAMIFS